MTPSGGMGAPEHWPLSRIPEPLLWEEPWRQGHLSTQTPEQGFPQQGPRLQDERPVGSAHTGPREAGMARHAPVQETGSSGQGCNSPSNPMPSRGCRGGRSSRLQVPLGVDVVFTCLQENHKLRDQNDDLNGQILSLSLYEAKNLFATQTKAQSLAAEIDTASRDEVACPLLLPCQDHEPQAAQGLALSAPPTTTLNDRHSCQEVAPGRQVSSGCC